MGVEFAWTFGTIFVNGMAWIVLEDIGWRYLVFIFSKFHNIVPTDINYIPLSHHIRMCIPGYMHSRISAYPIYSPPPLLLLPSPPPSPPPPRRALTYPGYSPRIFTTPDIHPDIHPRLPRIFAPFLPRIFTHLPRIFTTFAYPGYSPTFYPGYSPPFYPEYLNTLFSGRPLFSTRHLSAVGV